MANSIKRASVESLNCEWSRAYLFTQGETLQAVLGEPEIEPHPENRSPTGAWTWGFVLPNGTPGVISAHPYNDYYWAIWVENIDRDQDLVIESIKAATQAAGECIKVEYV